MAKRVYEENNIKAVAAKMRELIGSEEQFTTFDLARGVEKTFDAGYLACYGDLEKKAVLQMSILDTMMLAKFGTGEKDYFFSQANWDDLQRYNRAYVQAYDDENDLRLGEDGKGLYALRAICRYGAGTVPRYPWMKKSEWVAKYRENNPQTELTDEEIIANHPPKDTDFEYMATITERQPNGFIKLPTGFPTDKTVAQMEGYAVPKKYADAIKEIALGAVQKIECPDRNRYAYTVSLNSKNESIISLIKMGANPTADVNQPLIRRRVNGAVGTLKIPQADDDAASKYYTDQKFNGANKAVSYGNYSTMITALNSLSAADYVVGQNIMIVTLNVPDLWVSDVSTSKSTYTYTSDSAFVEALKANGSVKVGYYTLSALETQKVDLTEYAKASELTNGEITVKNASYALSSTEATYASYASLDRTKGTIEERLNAVGYFNSMGGAFTYATSNFIGTKNIENVPNGRTYLVRVKIFGSSYPEVCTFPIYLPASNEESGKFQTYHILSPNVGGDSADHIYINGASHGGENEANSRVGFSAFFNDASKITKVEYTIL